MKKIISLILAIALVCGVLSAFGAITVLGAEEALSATVWEPIEITFDSQEKYQNPYKEVELNAVFTHTDGTEIKLPGFWKERNTFAVRFSPTKVGTWTYTVSSNVADAALSRTGTIEATANTGNTELDKHGFVKVEEETSYFMYDDGTPFFWLGDTHWQAPNYEQTDVCNYPGCSCYSQFKHEIDNRVAKGFTVYQTYFDSAESDGGGQSGIIPSIWNERKNYEKPSAEVFNGKIDEMFSYMHEKGLVVALGFGVHSSTPSAITLDDLKCFARYVVARYACYSIVWITAQEITRDTPAKADPSMTTFQYWLQFAQYVDSIDGYDHPASAHMDVIDAYDPKSIQLSQESWHNCWASQGGHGAALLSKKSRYRAYTTYNQPVWEAEYNYEDINCGGFTGYDYVRYGAWNALLNGLAGYTYGATGIWANCYSNEKNTGWYDGFNSYNYEPWYIGLDKPGSYEMTYLKRFFETLPDWSKLQARYYNLEYGDFLNAEEKLMSSTEDNAVIVSYFRNTDTSTGTVYLLDKTKTYQALWYNPRTGAFIEYANGITGVDSYTVPEKPDKWDWIFLLTAEQLDPYYIEQPYTDPVASQNIGNIVTPYKVSAIGGFYYDNARSVNPTAYLYDLDGTNAWEPFAQRTTQTIIYDLGLAYDLTQLNIVPAVGTVLPKYRIEGSNDGENWTIIANATIRDSKMSADGAYVSEPLTGAYRYVKILFMNAETISLEDAETADHRVVVNTKFNACYSHTAIAEISVFASGVADNVETVKPVTGTPVIPQTLTTEGTTNVNVVIVVVAAVVGIACGVAVALIITNNKKKQSNL